MRRRIIELGSVLSCFNSKVKFSLMFLWGQSLDQKKVLYTLVAFLGCVLSSKTTFGLSAESEQNVRSTLIVAESHRAKGRLANARGELESWLKCHLQVKNFDILAALARIQYEQLALDDAAVTWIDVLKLPLPASVKPWVKDFSEKWPETIGGLEVRGNGRKVVLDVIRTGLVVDPELTRAFLEREGGALKRYTNRVIYLPAGRYRVEEKLIEILPNEILTINLSELGVEQDIYRKAKEYSDPPAHGSVMRECREMNMVTASQSIPDKQNFFRKTWPWWVGGVVVFGATVGLAVVHSSRDKYVIDFQAENF